MNLAVKCHFFLSTISKNENSGHKSKFWSEIKILAKNRNFGQISNFRTKVEILVRNQNLGRNCETTETFWNQKKL